MSQRSSVLASGATLHQAEAAYLDAHPLDHDDDVEVEHGTSSFRELDPSNVNWFYTGSNT